MDVESFQKPRSFWEPLRLKEDRTYFWRIGALEFWVHKNDGEWLVTHRLQNEPCETAAPVFAAQEEKPGELEWNHFFADSGSSEFLLHPMLPDRPVVVRTEYPVNIAPGANILFYVDIPIRIALGTVQSGAKKGEAENPHAALQEFIELPTRQLSNTWFGGPMTGRLCYSLPTVLYRDTAGREVPPHSAVCPLRLKNTSKKSFSVGKISVFTEFLKLYLDSDQLWTGEAQATFVGNEELQVSVSDRKPDTAGKTRLIAQARTSAGEHLLRKSIILLKSFTSL